VGVDDIGGWAADPWREHRERVAEVLGRARSGVVAGFGTAAAVHGLPLPGSPPGRVELIVPRSGGGRRTEGRRVRPLPLDDDEITVVDGLAVTTVARTVFDLAATGDRVAALVVADHALRHGWCSLDDVEACLGRHPGRHGRSGVSFVLTHADGRSRSPATTVSRYVMWRHGSLPRPDLSPTVRGFFDDEVGAADFGWDGGRVLGVVDDGPSAAGLLSDEAAVELDQLGVRVIRWSDRELDAPQRLLGRLHEALDRRVPRSW